MILFHFVILISLMSDIHRYPPMGPPIHDYVDPVLTSHDLSVTCGKGNSTVVDMFNSYFPEKHGDLDPVYPMPLRNLNARRSPTKRMM